MTDFAQHARALEGALALTTPAVAVTFADSLPTGVSPPVSTVPAGCSFWEVGSTQTVGTSAEHHMHCSIGTHTHTLADAPQSQGMELGATLAAMRGLDYVRPNEVEALPVMQKSSRHVVYGPLRDATQSPSVVLLFARASQGLVLTEALARVDGGPPLVMGRPACALVPQVINSQHSVSSLGCCGARAYLDALGDDIALWGLVGDKLTAYVKEIETLAKANTVLTQFHELRLKAIESGETPTVEESLAQLK